jgi:hypothetical protein
MNLDDLLRETLHDDRLALPVPAGTLDVVRRKRRTRQRLAVAGTAVCALGLVGGVVASTSLRSSPASSLSPYADGGGVPEGSAVPSVSPAYVPTSGRSWILTPAEWATYRATHTQPSPPAGQSVVPSPAPLGQQSADLLADVQKADLPAGVKDRREDSVGGQPGAAAVHLTLADGTPVEVFRSQLVEPQSTEQNGPGSDPDATIVAVPGTTSAAGLFPSYGYGFPERHTDTAHMVMVVTRGGQLTQWVAPSSVSLDTLQAWAFAAAQD